MGWLPSPDTPFEFMTSPELEALKTLMLPEKAMAMARIHQLQQLIDKINTELERANRPADA